MQTFVFSFIFKSIMENMKKKKKTQNPSDPPCDQGEPIFCPGQIEIIKKKKYPSVYPIGHTLHKKKIKKKEETRGPLTIFSLHFFVRLILELMSFFSS